EWCFSSHIMLSYKLHLYLGYRPVARIGRAPVSKTLWWGFEYLLACQTCWRVTSNFWLGGRSLLEKISLTQVKEFFNDVKVEMRRVSWPGRKEVYGTTIVVIAAVFFFGIYLGWLDLVLMVGVTKIFHLFR